MTTPEHTPRLSAAAATAFTWQAQAALVPAAWREPIYQIDAPEHRQVFRQNSRYLGRRLDFTPPGCPPRFAREVAWYVWLCATDQIAKIEPAYLRWCCEAISLATHSYTREHGHPPVSITDLTSAALVRHALLAYQARNKRLPPVNTRRSITHLIEQLHLYLSVRCTDRSWWEHDIWDLRVDPRIPQRDHEPSHDMCARLGGIEPAWLREGVRFWLRVSITAELLRWSSAVERSRMATRHLGRFLTDTGHTDDPVLADDPARLRMIFTEFAAWLRSPAASARPDRRLTGSAIEATVSQTQVFYTFMVDHAPEAAAATGIARWGEVGPAHTRLWGPAFRRRAAPRNRELTWYSTGDLQRMLCYLDVLAADRGRHVTLTHPDGTVSLVAGLGDPQAARIWLLQALTGRRASEILMLDVDPIEPIPGFERPPTAPAEHPANRADNRVTSRVNDRVTGGVEGRVGDGVGTEAVASDDAGDGEDSGVFVAKLRYQQTKVDGVIPTILIEQAVVNVIAEQQAWLAAAHPDWSPRYLFVPLRDHHQGRRHRPYNSYRQALSGLDRIHGLTDSTGRPLRFTQTHRLRHTRATELLNDGVPLHVVQRYLGHKSPEMTLRYAATLAATSEAEFLKHKKIGAGGVDIALSPSDIYDMTQLAKRTDRVLPNGVCLLPPVKTCDKGNACLSCGHFATDATHLDELRAQHAATTALLQARREQFHARTGRTLTDDNIWVHQRLRELHSLEQIITRLTAEEPGGEPGQSAAGAVTGAGAANRLPILQIQTRGSHESALRTAAGTTAGTTAGAASGTAAGTGGDGDAAHSAGAGGGAS
ncbi:site-specific tyrosine recombinase XerC (plasmid) [Tsukamurella tyrosinosolvens]|uniref:Phage integrase family protein n=2 Tax=Tsukamurella TaxID=2060 RepID=A0A1H1BEV2_9ACTN|nr:MULTISPECIES: tyrosine-type recombinase/integrase [Tsukamurella]SDQ50544.1 Phage integrase family protein [Tsukamurella pulmonis]SED54238.1 Phage integrase family protein [Tsukamurella tyrosinosolvens]SUP25244.1 site-specific tyrosine recombinase XerC [Tsukamurella pulmonis]VEI01636.1 site-specific tyrosine recombinase XerC [Tsukamurella tyrosinosolvens]